MGMSNKQLSILVFIVTIREINHYLQNQIFNVITILICIAILGVVMYKEYSKTHTHKLNTEEEAKVSSIG